MYYLLAALNGCIIAVMVALNGGLSDQYGVFLAAVIIHVTPLSYVRLRAGQKGCI